MENNNLSTDDKYKRKTGICDVLLIIVLVFMVGYFAVTPLRNAQLRHVFVLGGSIAIYGISLLSMLKTKYSTARVFRLFAIIILLIFGVVISNRNTIEVGYAYLNYLALYIVLTNKIEHHFTFDIWRLMYYFSLVVAVFLFLAYRSPAAYIFEDGRSTTALALGMTNPNLTGMMITSVIELMMIGFKARKHKALLSLMAIGLLYLAYLTGARSSLVACILVLVYTIFLSEKKIPNVLIYIIVAVSLLFVPIYLALYRHGFSNITLMGKILFSGREYTYISYINQLNSPMRWLFGNLGETLFSNAHNAPLMIICSIGLLGLVLTYHGFVRNLIILNNEALEPANRVAIACILGVCVQSCGEALMFSGVFPSIGFMYVFMMLSAYSDK